MSSRQSPSPMLERKPRKDRTEVTFVLPANTLPSKSTHAFRYLAADGYWFNDESTSSQERSNSRVRT